MSNPFNKNRARKTPKIQDIYETALFVDFYSRFKPFGTRREAEFKRDLEKLCRELVAFGYEEGIATKAEIGARRLGSRGGEKGGPARARKLSPERRKEIARQAANIRWARATARVEIGGGTHSPIFEVRGGYGGRPSR